MKFNREINRTSVVGRQNWNQGLKLSDLIISPDLYEGLYDITYHIGNTYRWSIYDNGTSNALKSPLTITFSINHFGTHIQNQVIKLIDTTDWLYRKQTLAEKNFWKMVDTLFVSYDFDHRDRNSPFFILWKICQRQ